jgi:subtilisin family serine protease
MATITDKIGPLLFNAMLETVRVDATAPNAMFRAMAGNVVRKQASQEESLPAIVRVAAVEPIRGEGWKRFKQRMYERVEPMRENMQKLVGAEVPVSYAAGAMQVLVQRRHIATIAADNRTVRIELDPIMQLTALDDCVNDLGRPMPLGNGGGALDGSGVRVAVLDSGVDESHPALKVAESASTSDEELELPGRHGTHCAGIIASRDPLYAGVAPGVTLLNIKVLSAGGYGRPGMVARGVDAALDRQADVLSISISFNHLPLWWKGGHGWTCPDGRCEVCLAITNAVISDGVVAVVAVGNEHDRAEEFRKTGLGTLDTEITCPGQCVDGISIAAVTKNTHLTASFSSRGPTAFAVAKPDLAAPGVDIMSTVPVPRGADGKPVADPPRALLFGRDSGTSMATPLVAGAAALIIQRAKIDGTPITPAFVRRQLLSRGVGTLGQAATEVGAGHLDLRGL